VLPSSGESFPHLIHKHRSQLGFVTHLLTFLRTYVSLMYELKKKIVKVFTSKFVGTGPSSFEKKNLPGRGLTKVEKHCSRVCDLALPF